MIIESRPRRPRVAVLLAVLAVVVAAVALGWPRTTVVKVIDQPAGVAYSDDSAHFAVVRQIRAPIAAIRPAQGYYEVVLGRDPGGDYGHHVRFEATDLDPADLAVDWTAEGAWLGYRSGHRVFVPATFFVGGR